MDILLQIDGNCLLWIQEYLRQDFWTPFWTFITSLGDAGWFWIALAFVLAVFPKTRKAGFLALASLALCALITNACLKNVIARPRPYTQIPDLTALIPPQKDWSFPSGHATASFASAGIYLRTLPKKYGLASLALAMLIAFSRLYVGVHYPTDILGGVAIGLLGSWIVCKSKTKRMEL